MAGDAVRARPDLPRHAVPRVRARRPARLGLRHRSRVPCPAGGRLSRPDLVPGLGVDQARRLRAPHRLAPRGGAQRAARPAPAPPAVHRGRGDQRRAPVRRARHGRRRREGRVVGRAARTSRRTTRAGTSRRTKAGTSRGFGRRPAPRTGRPRRGTTTQDRTTRPGRSSAHEVATPRRRPAGDAGAAGAAGRSGRRRQPRRGGRRGLGLVPAGGRVLLVHRRRAPASAPQRGHGALRRPRRAPAAVPDHRAPGGGEGVGGGLPRPDRGPRPDAGVGAGGVVGRRRRPHARAHRGPAGADRARRVRRRPAGPASGPTTSSCAPCSPARRRVASRTPRTRCCASTTSSPARAGTRGRSPGAGWPG